MAAGGGRGTGFISGIGGTLDVLNGVHNSINGSSENIVSDGAGTGAGPGGLQTQNSFSSLSTTSDSSDTELGRQQQRHVRSDSVMSQTQQRPLR
ncbi:hypothetical protein F66182_12415, partial [Fusarium sp. NRRL 66182]